MIPPLLFICYNENTRVSSDALGVCAFEEIGKIGDLITHLCPDDHLSLQKPIAISVVALVGDILPSGAYHYAISYITIDFIW